MATHVATFHDPETRRPRSTNPSQVSGPNRCCHTDQGLGKPLAELGVHPMHQNTQLASGLINGHDRLTIETVQPLDMPAAILLRWPTKPSIATPDAYANDRSLGDAGAGGGSSRASGDQGLAETVNDGGGM